MAAPEGFSDKVAFVWKVADKLRGHFKPHEVDFGRTRHLAPLSWMYSYPDGMSSFLALQWPAALRPQEGFSAPPLHPCL